MLAGFVSWLITETTFVGRLFRGGGGIIEPSPELTASIEGSIDARLINRIP